MERTSPVFKGWSTDLLKKREAQEIRSGGFGKLPIFKEFEYIQPPKIKLKKRKEQNNLPGKL